MRSRTLALFLLTFAFSLPAVAQPAPSQPPADQPPADQPPAAQPPPGQPPATPPPAEQPPPAEPPSDQPAETAPPETPADDTGEGPDPSRPPPKGKGVVWGVIMDPKLKEPMLEVQVSAIGTKFKTQSDVDGRFRLELPPGTYNLRFFFEQYKPVRVDAVHVVAGHVTRLDAELVLAEESAEETVVETEADKAATETQILRRQRSAAVGDSVGRAEISKTPDRNAAQSAQRVVGANIVGGRFVYVRGLGERYTNALLNGTPLPSPEPDVNAVPLDLFPALVLDSLTIAKTFTPDSPGDFAGGSVRIETREIPSKLLFSPSVTLGYNTDATFRDRLAYRGSSTDWLGFDDGLRAMPKGLPNYKLTRGSKRPDGTFVLPADLEPYGESINTYMSSERKFTPPNYGASVVVGKGYDLGQSRGVGFLGALTYSRGFTIKDEIYREYRADHTRGVDYDLESGNDAVRWGAFGSVTYAFAKGQKLSLIGLRSQLSDNSARTTQGPNGSDSVVHQTRLSFVSRELSSGQIRGEHEITPLNRALFEWNLSLSHAGRSEPNTRDDVWEYQPESSELRYHYAGSNVQAGRHLYTDQGETAYGGGIDFTQPLLDAPRETKLKVGGLMSRRTRAFKARRFNFEFAGSPAAEPPAYCPGPGYSESCADALFRNENIGPIIRLNESTQPSDAYNAKLNIYAGYFMGDIGLTRDLRVSGGERIEVTEQKIDPFDQFDTGAKQSGADLQSTDLLPAVGLVYSLTKETKLRAAATRTLARPQLRELAPYAWNEVVGGKTYTGNPDLKLTKITNLDLRFEFFPTLREVLAASVFTKHFVDPIEAVIYPASGSSQVSYENSAAADLYGIELEARKSLAFLNKALDDFSLITNLTIARSSIKIRQTGTNFITHTERALSNQAPYVLNVAIDYASDKGISARLLYNVVGARVVEVGTGGLDDSYEQPRHRIDASVSYDLDPHLNLKFTAENLLNAPVVVTVGKEARDDNIARKYTEGTVFSISAAYTY